MWYKILCHQSKKAERSWVLNGEMSNNIGGTSPGCCVGTWERDKVSQDQDGTLLRIPCDEDDTLILGKRDQDKIESKISNTVQDQDAITPSCLEIKTKYQVLRPISRARRYNRTNVSRSTPRLPGCRKLHIRVSLQFIYRKENQSSQRPVSLRLRPRQHIRAAWTSMRETQRAALQPP